MKSLDNMFSGYKSKTKKQVYEQIKNLIYNPLTEYFTVKDKN